MRNNPVSDFPAGLFQPEGSYRFGMEALLLADRGAALAPEGPVLLADAGCGCGASALAFALKRPEALCVGFDREPALISAARINAEMLGVAGRCSFIETDLADLPGLYPWRGKCQLVLANPPWRNSGRKTLKPLRAAALWADAGTFDAFCKAAASLLDQAGRLLCAISCQRVPDFSNALEKAGLYVEERRSIASREKPAKICLLTCALR